MKKIICLLAIMTTIQVGYSQKTLSQDYSYNVSEPYKVFDAKQKFYLTKGNQTMTVKFDGDDVLIQKFDNDKPAFIKDKAYEKFFPKHYQIEDVLEVGDKFYVFYSSWDGDNKQEQLFSQEINFETGEFADSPKLMFKVDGKVVQKSSFGMSFGWFGFASAGDKFDVFRSYDKKNVLVQYRRVPEVKNDKKSYDIIGLGAFNSKLEKLSLKEITMPYTERRMNNLDYQLDNKGNLYMLTKVFHDDSNDDKKSRNDTIANYHIELFTIKAGSDKINISQFNNNNKFINRLWLFDTNKDYLVCGGYYSNGKGKINGGGGFWGSNKTSNTGESDGIVVFKIKTSDGSIYDQYFHEIPLDVLNAYESKRTIRKNEKKEEKGISAKIPDLELRDIAVLDDGSMMLVGEQYFKVFHQSGGGMGMGGFSGGSGYYTYHYGDILTTKIAADGTLSFMNKIPKIQVGKAGKGGMSIKYFFANNNHYLVFLDNVKNIDLPEGKTPAEHSDGKGGYLTSVKIADSDGTLTKGSILNAREVEDFKIYQFSTDRIFKTSENTFMFEAYKKGKEDIMIKVTLNK